MWQLKIVGEKLEVARATFVLLRYCICNTQSIYRKILTRIANKVVTTTNL